MTDIPAAQTQTAMLQARQAEMTGARAKIEKTAGEVKNMAAIEAAAKDFEAMFLSEMLRPMFDGIKPDPMFGGGKGEEVFQGLMLEEYGKSMAESGGIGLAQHVKEAMIRIQEEAQR